jgi:hypothetical protein
MHIDCIQHIISFIHPWYRIQCMMVNHDWYTMVRLLTKPLKFNDAIRRCDYLAVAKNRRSFALPLILAQACRTSDPIYRDVIRVMLKFGIYDWNPAIASACEVGNTKMVGYLLQRFTKYNYDFMTSWFRKDKPIINLQLALCNACYSGNLHTIALVLRHLNCVRKKQRYYNYPTDVRIQWQDVFFKTCEGGNLKAVKYIFSQIPEQHRWEGLPGAYLGGHMPLVKLLEGMGLHPNEQCLLNAIKSGNSEVINHACTIPDVFMVDKAIIPRHVKAQVITMPNVVLVDSPISMKFYRACSSNNLDLVCKYEAIIKQNASLYTRMGNLGLLHACRAGHRELMQHFMTQGMVCSCGRSTKLHKQYISYKLYMWIDVQD